MSNHAGASTVPTPYSVICEGPYDLPDVAGCGHVFLTKQEYINQMNRPDSTWRCPHCGSEAAFDDVNFEFTFPVD